MRQAALLLGTCPLIAAGKDVQTQSNPLKKVVTLITEMKAQTEKEADADKAAYEKYACWCTTNDKEKTTAIEVASDRLDQQNSFVEQAAATIAELKTDIERLIADMAEDKDALETAAAIRAKEADQFKTNEADLVETLDALVNAVDVLSKVQLLQKQQGDTGEVREQVHASLVQVSRVVAHHRPVYRDILQKDLFDVLGSLADPSDKKGASFLGSEDPTTGGAAKGSKSYNSRSGAIFGILSSMKEQTERDLDSARKGEDSASKAFARLKHAKETEIAAANEQKGQKQAELAELTKKMVEAKGDINLLEKAKAADETFLANLKASCQKEANEYESRVKVRTEEIVALGETLKILTEDDARDLFGKTMSFVQISASHESQSALLAMKRLAAFARKRKSASLASLAVRIGLDGFEKVKQTMDKMVAELKSQLKEEYEKNEKCKKDIDTTEDEIKVATNEKEDLDEEHKAQTNDLAVLSSDIEKLSQDVSDMKVSLKQASEERVAENAVFQQTVSDQRATIDVLNKALARLAEFYGGAELVQVHTHRQEPGAAVPPPPPTPKAYSKRPAGGVMQLLQMIITDATKIEQEMMVSEKNAQADYATFVSDTTASIDSNNKAIAAKEAASSATKGEKAETQEAQLANGESLMNLNKLLSAHHASCDWVVKYFDIRQQARQEEIDSIEEAKAILSGAKFGGSASFEQEKAEEFFDNQ